MIWPTTTTTSTYAWKKQSKQTLTEPIAITCTLVWCELRLYLLQTLKNVLNAWLNYDLLKHMKKSLKSTAKVFCFCISLVGLSCLTAFATPINQVQNGSFENGWQNGPIDWSWTYNVALVLGVPNAADGADYAQVYGTLFQTLQTTPGQEYQLQFALSGNFSISSPTVIDVLWNGINIGAVSWNPAGHNVNNLGWVWSDFDVTATTSTSLLTFANPYVGDGSQRIPNLDAVSVYALSVPDKSATVWLLGSGMLGILIAKRWLGARFSSVGGHAV